jgi:hypothetical protein
MSSAKKKYDLRGAKYTIKYARIKDRGSCESPKEKAPTIKINNKLKGAERLEVLIHEVMHACLWDLDEEAVQETSLAIANVVEDHFIIEDK